MSAQAQYTGGQKVWDQPQFTFKQPPQLEELPHPFDTSLSSSRFPHQLQNSPSSLRYASYSSAAPFGTSSGFARQPQMRTPSMNPPDLDINVTLDTSSSCFATSSHSTHVSPAYNQPGMGALEPNLTNYQISQFGTTVKPNPTPENSPNSNAITASHLTPSPYLPAGPMQFPPALPLPLRQSELQAHYFNAAPVRQKLDPLPHPKRPKPSDDYDDSQGEQHDAQEQDAARPSRMGACARCKGLKVRCDFRNNSDTCKRCTTAGQECVIPGRKPRRVPPKREHLLNQIREQAKQIQELMAKVEALNGPQFRHLPGSSRPSPLESNSESVVPNAEMQDWISRARVSLQEFGGLIPAGDPADAGESYASDEDTAAEEYSDDESGYATAEDETSKDVGSPASSTTKRQTAQTTSLKMLPGEDAPYGLMAALSIRTKAREKSAEPESSEAVGVANAHFFRPSPGPDPKRLNPSTAGVQLPHILARNIVTTKEVDSLFSIYFDKMNPSANLLDPALHTPQYVAMRSPFLFTIMCGIASRFYEPRPNLYQQLIQYGQLAAGTALISGTKNEEMSAAYLLMQLYPVPARRWDEERSWIYLGLAIRVAQDINLHRPVATRSLNEQNARVLLSRQRIWMNCFNLDRSTGTQYGKRPVIPDTDYFALHSEDWWKSSPYNIKGFDIHLCGYNAELRFISGFWMKIYGDPNHPIGLNKNLNIAQLASDTDDELRQLGERWFRRLEEFEEEKTEMWEYRSGLLRMAYAYARLVALSTGLKHAKEGQLDENSFLMRCWDAASEIVDAFVRKLFPTPERKTLLRHAPDAQLVFVTFAGAFLVKLLQPKYSQHFTHERRQEIRTLIQEAVDLLGAPEVFVDDKHGPKLFSRFLAGLLAAQSVKQDAFSENVYLQRTSSRSKVTSGKRKGPNGTLSPSSLHTSGSGPEFSSPPAFSESPSPVQHLIPFADNSRGQSPSAIDSGLGFHIPDIYQAAPMPVDQELLDSISFMSDPAWQDTTVPGFNWVNQLNTTRNAMPHTNDYPLYESLQYGMSY